MKRNAFILATALLPMIPVIARAAGEDIPRRPTFARYEAMMNKSPFAVATAAVAPPSTPNFAKDLYIANAARMADEGLVTLTSTTDKNIKEYLSTRSPNLHGYSISNIEWSDRIGATKVTISKDGQFATLAFNQALLTQAPGSLPPQPQVMPQNVPQPFPVPTAFANPNQIRPAPIPMLPTPPPRVRGVIQRNPIQPPQQPGGVETPDQ